MVKDGLPQDHLRPKMTHFNYSGDGLMRVSRDSCRLSTRSHIPLTFATRQLRRRAMTKARTGERMTDILKIRQLLAHPDAAERAQGLELFRMLDLAASEDVFKGLRINRVVKHRYSDEPRTFIVPFAKTMTDELLSALLLGPDDGRERWQRKRKFHELTHVNLSGSEVVSPDALASLPQLQTLALDKCRQLKSLEFLSSLPDLVNLTLRDDTNGSAIPDPTPIRHCTKLQRLTIQSVDAKVRDIEWLRPLSALVHLTVKGPKVEDTSALRALPHLTNLTLAVSLRSTADFAALEALEQLDLQGCKDPKDYSGLRALKKLHRLRLPFGAKPNNWSDDTDTREDVERFLDVACGGATSPETKQMKEVLAGRNEGSKERVVRQLVSMAPEAFDDFFRGTRITVRPDGVMDLRVPFVDEDAASSLWLTWVVLHGPKGGRDAWRARFGLDRVAGLHVWLHDEDHAATERALKLVVQELSAVEHVYLAGECGDFLSVIPRERIRRLEVNTPVDWGLVGECKSLEELTVRCYHQAEFDGHLSFLARCPNLRSFATYYDGLGPLASVEGLRAATKLEVLDLTYVHTPKTGCDLSALAELPALKKVLLPGRGNWIPKPVRLQMGTRELVEDYQKKVRRWLKSTGQVVSS